MQNSRLMTALGAALLLAGCAAPTLHPDFGNSYRNNTMVQRMDPGAEGRERPAATVDGQKAEKGLARYRTDKPDSSRETLVQKTGN